MCIGSNFAMQGIYDVLSRSQEDVNDGVLVLIMRF